MQPNGSTDGYWKLLIDYKIYDNSGKGSPQGSVTANFNIEEATRMLDEYGGNPNELPVAQDVIDAFVAKYTDNLNPTDNPDIRFSAKDSEALTIKEQILQHQTELNRMNPVANIESEARPRKDGKPDRTLMRKALQAFYGSLKYGVDRKGFGRVMFDENALSELCNYITSDAEFAAAKAASSVIKRGIEIEHHIEHNRHSDVESYTFAAPVVLNGKRGNEAVVVQYTNRNKPHCVRILMPDGSGFDLDAIKGSSPNRSQGVQENSRGQLMQTASSNTIPDTSKEGKGRMSLEDRQGIKGDRLRALNSEPVQGVRFSARETLLHFSEFYIKSSSTENSLIAGRESIHVIWPLKSLKNTVCQYHL